MNDDVISSDVRSEKISFISSSTLLVFSCLYTWWKAYVAIF